MATAFPTALDVLNDPGAGTYTDDPNYLHDVQHANANDAITALQTKLGINNSPITSTIDYVLHHHQHSGTDGSQTITSVTAQPAVDGTVSNLKTAAGSSVFNVNTTNTAPTTTIMPPSGTTVGLAVQQPSGGSPTADMAQFQNSTATALAGVASDGGLYSSGALKLMSAVGGTAYLQSTPASTRLDLANGGLINGWSGVVNTSAQTLALNSATGQIQVASAGGGTPAIVTNAWNKNRTSSIQIIGKNNANSGLTAFTTLVDADGQTVGNRSYSVLGNIANQTTGTYIGTDNFFELSYPSYDGVSTYTKAAGVSVQPGVAPPQTAGSFGVAGNALITGNLVVQGTFSVTGNLSYSGQVTAGGGLGLGSGAQTGPGMHSDGTNVYIETASAASIYFRPNGPGSSLDQVTIDRFGDVVAPGALSAGAVGTAGRYIGSTVGAPTSGTWLANDFATDFVNECVWICSVGGAPGTWISTSANNLYHSSLDVRSFGAVCDGSIAFDVAVTGTNVTSAKLQPFAGSKVFIVDGAGAGSDYFQTTITCTAAGTGTLALAPTNNVTNACAIWGTDDSAAWRAALTAAYNQNGGDIFFPGISVVAQANSLNPPNNNTTSNPYNGGVVPPNTAGTKWGPWQPAIRIHGNGGYFDGQWGGELLATGSIIVLPVAAPTGPGKISTYGVGAFEIDHCTLLSLGNPTYPMVYTTNTTLNVHDMAMAGQPSKLRTTCNQDAFVLGGSSTNIGTSTNAPFQGYTSQFTNVYCDRLRTIFQTGQYANGLLTRNVQVSSTCGSALTNGAAYMLTGDVGHAIGPDTIELPGYVYAVTLAGTTNSTFHIIAADAGNGTAGQATTKGVLYAASNGGTPSTQNVITCPWPVGQILTEDAASQGANKILNVAGYECYMTMTTNPSIASGTVTQLAFTTATSDPLHACNTTYGAYAVTQNSWYKVMVQAAFNSSMPTGYQCGVGLFVTSTANNPVNTNPTIQGFRVASGPIAGAQQMFRVWATAGEYISGAVFHTCTTSQALSGANCYLQVEMD